MLGHSRRACAVQLHVGKAILPAIRSLSSEAVKPQPTRLQRAKKYAQYGALFGFSSICGLAALGGIIFIHDAFTYTDKHVERVPLSPLALHPEPGGPKNLPIVRVSAADEDSEEHKKLATKPRLVIVGGGWGVSD